MDLILKTTAVRCEANGPAW